MENRSDYLYANMHTHLCTPEYVLASTAYSYTLKIFNSMSWCFNLHNLYYTKYIYKYFVVFVFALVG